MFLAIRHQMATKKKKDQLVSLDLLKNHTVIHHQRTLKLKTEKEITPLVMTINKNKKGLNL